MTGEPSFFELGVADAQQARVFYQGLFGWSMQPGPSGAGFEIDTAGIPGGLHGSDPQASPYLFFRVDDLDDALERVLALGGTVDAPIEDEEDPGSVTRYGRFRLCRDDQGCAFGLHEPPA